MNKTGEAACPTGQRTPRERGHSGQCGFLGRSWAGEVWVLAQQEVALPGQQLRGESKGIMGLLGAAEVQVQRSWESSTLLVCGGTPGRPVDRSEGGKGRGHQGLSTPRTGGHSANGHSLLAMHCFESAGVCLENVLFRHH